MELNKQVCSLEQAKKLAELGVNQESLFCYQPIKDELPRVWPRHFNLNEFCKPSKDERIAAYTTAELGKLLPWDITIARNIDKQWHTFFCGNGLPSIIAERTCVMSENNEADSRAKLLIMLIENGLHKIGETT